MTVMFMQIVVTSSSSAEIKMFMTNTKTQCREIQPWYDSRGLEKWNTECCAWVPRCGMVRDGARGGPGNLMAIHSSPTVHYRNTGLEPNKTDFRVTKSTKKKNI